MNWSCQITAAGNNLFSTILQEGFLRQGQKKHNADPLTSPSLVFHWQGVIFWKKNKHCHVNFAPLTLLDITWRVKPSAQSWPDIIWPQGGTAPTSIIMFACVCVFWSHMGLLKNSNIMSSRAENKDINRHFFCLQIKTTLMELTVDMQENSCVCWKLYKDTRMLMDNELNIALGYHHNLRILSHSHVRYYTSCLSVLLPVCVWISLRGLL